MNKSTFIFNSGRKKYLYDEDKAKDHFYAVTFFIKEEKYVEIIEFEEEQKSIFSKLLYLYDKVLNKLFSVPSYTHKLVSFKNLKILMKSKKIYLVNESVGFSSLPMLICIKLLTKNKVNLFVMGLYSKNINSNFFQLIHNFFIKFLIFMTDNVLFLGKGEMKKAEMFHINSNKLKYVGFAIDTNFWKNSNIFPKQHRDYILFVGNDQNRDIKLLLDIAKQKSDLKFLFLTNLQFDEKKLPGNINLIRGSWKDNDISDNDLKEIYKKALITIIPLKDSFQPSGQSVCLQSMCVGTPVLISKTKGFWDTNLFKDQENIYFADNSISDWSQKIDKILVYDPEVQKVIRNSQKIVLSELDIQNYFKKIKLLTD